MKQMYVNDLKEQVGKEVRIGVFVKSFNCVKKGERSYYAMTLVDKTGEVSGKVWHENMKEAYEKLNEKYVVLKAKVDEFENRPILNIISMKEIKDTALDLGDYVELNIEPDSAVSRLEKYINQVKSDFIFSLLSVIFSKREVIESFMMCQGNTTSHYDYPGGLPVHSFSVVDGLLSYCERSYEGDQHQVSLNRDLLIAGGLLHDIGKINAYHPFPINKRTKIGKLNGHINLGIDIVTAAFYEVLARNSEIVDYETYDELKHMIYSSHFDGDIKAMTLEAILLQKVNHMDSSLAGARSAIYKEKDSQKGDSFTVFNKKYGKQFLKREMS